MLEKCVSENFMRKEHLNMWTFVNQPEEVIAALRNAEAWTKDALNFATYR
jgi:hypothetical protein